MKILLANKFYYPRGGDCTYILNLRNLLESHGHETAVFAMQYPENIPSPWSGYFPSEIKFTPGLKMLEAFFRPFGTGEVKRKFTKLLDDFRPDIVHLGNIHTQLSPVLAKIAHGKGIKVVWTLHDYKLLCPRYDCLRNGATLCEACFSDKHKVLEYKCMKNSRIASYIAYREALKWPREKLENYTDAFISPSRFLKDKMVQGGFTKEKIRTCCNFINTAKVRRENYDKDDYYCYVGRLSHEKGIGTLIEAAKGLPLKLKIIGNGPLQEILTAQAAGADIELLGYRQWDEIKEIVGKARFCVLPSEWYENNPFSVIESQCLGTPVLDARIGGIPELIDEGKTGMLFMPGNAEELKTQIAQMFATPFEYRQIALDAQKRYSAERYYTELMKIYNNI